MAVFPLENVLSKLPPPSSKMATDVNSCSQTPTPIACQVLPSQIYNRAAHSWIARGRILYERHRNWSPMLSSQVVVLLMEASVRRQDSPYDDCSGGCRALGAMQSVLLTLLPSQTGKQQNKPSSEPL